MTTHIFLSCPPHKLFTDKLLAIDDEIIYWHRDISLWSNNGVSDSSRDYTTHVLFKKRILNDYLNIANDLSMFNWLDVDAIGNESIKQPLFILSNHLHRFLNASCLLIACAQQAEPVTLYLSRDNIIHSDSGHSLSEVSILSIAARHATKHSFMSRDKIRFMRIEPSISGNEEDCNLESLKDVSAEIYDMPLGIPAFSIDEYTNRRRILSNIFDLTHVRNPANVILTDKLSYPSNSLLMVNKSSGVWGAIDSSFLESCDIFFYHFESIEINDESLFRIEDEYFSHLCDKFKPAKIDLSSLPSLQSSIINSLPEILFPLYISLEQSIEKLCDALSSCIAFSPCVGCHVSESNYVIKEAFSRVFTNKLSVSIYPHSFTSCTYESIASSDKVKILSNCPFPTGLSVSVSRFGVCWQSSYPRVLKTITIPDRLREILSTWYRPVRDGKSLTDKLSIGIFLGSEIEGIEIVSNPLITRDYVFKFCEICESLNIEIVMNIFPKTIWQSQAFTEEIYRRKPGLSSIIIHSPSHTGINLEVIKMLDCHLFWGHGSVNLEAAFMAIPSLNIKSIQSGIHLSDTDITGYGVVPLDIDPLVMSSSLIAHSLDRISLKNEGLKQQTQVLLQMYRFIHLFV